MTRLLAVLVLSLAWGEPLRAVSLPVRRFGLAEGLAGTHVNHVLRDSRGFLWLATSDGLSRFDGESFRDFGVPEGLPSSDVSRVVEGEDGTLWFATAAGLGRMRKDAPPERPIERVGEARGVAAICRGRGLWVVHQPGDVARLLDPNGRIVRSVPLGRDWGGIAVLAEIPEGLVVGTGSGLRMVAPDGTVRARSVRPHRGGDEVHDLLVDGSGRLVVAHGFGLFVAAGPGRLFAAEDAPELARVAGPLVAAGRLKLPGPEGEVRVLTTGATPEAPSFFESVTLLPDGRLFAATRNAAVFLEPGRVEVLDLSREIEGASLSAIAEDAGGSLWLGTTVNGAIRLLRSGFVTFGREDGLASPKLTSVFRDRSGALFVTAGLAVSRLEGERFRTAVPALPPSVKDVGWGSRQVAFFDRDGDYWFASADGLLRYDGPFERLDGRLPRQVFTEADGLCGREVFRVFEDRAGDIWASSFGGPCQLARRDRASGRFRRYAAEDGMPPSTATAFAEDANGSLWLGSYGDGVFLVQGDRLVRPGAGAPTAAIVTTVVRGAGGRMLVGTSSKGLHVARLDGVEPRWQQLTVRNGLASDKVLTVVEGRDGLVYVGTPKGVDRVDLDRGRVRHLSYENGFPGDAVASMADGEGCLLFATRFGLGRLCAGKESPPPPAPVLFSTLHVGGLSVPVSPFGQGGVDVGRVGPAPLPVEVEFFGLSFVPGERLTYRYRVHGLDAAWSAPRPDRVVRLAAVPAGRYRLEVQAMRSGEPAGGVATLTFEIVPPFYRRPAFFGAVAVVVAGLALLLERARVRHLVAVERVRTRIATDLHDDLGSSLSRISILSEVALGKLEEGSPASRLLGEIGTTARELIDALSDSIWSVDPRRDDLQSLLDRVKRFSGDVFEAHGVAWHLEAPEDAARVPLSPLERRHLFLLVKEALHNVVKHARAHSVAVSVSRRGRRLLLTVTDDGVGLGGAPRSPDGHGLDSMHARAASLGGTLRLEVPGAGGTRLVLDVPLSHA